MIKQAFDICYANHMSALHQCKQFIKEGKLDECRQWLKGIENNLNNLEKNL